MIEKFAWYRNSEQGNKFMIVGGGGSTREFRDEIILKCIIEKYTTIGINRVIIQPDYHLWTNNQRLNDHNDCITNHSTLMLGQNITPELRNMFHNYIDIHYTKSDSYYGYRNGQIYGTYRTAGILAIMIAHLMGAAKIDIVGMDGFTLHNKMDLHLGKKSQHCYGSGYTDDATWLQCIEKDKLVYNQLRSLANIGIKFSILTPTVFEDFRSPRCSQINGITT